MHNFYVRKIIQEYIRFTVPKGLSHLIISSKNRISVLKNRNIYDYIILLNVTEQEEDIQLLIEEAGEHLNINGRLIIIYNNFLQSFFTDFLKSLTGKLNHNNNWLSTYDINTFLNLAGFETITQQPLCFINFNIPVISGVLNKLILYFFPFNHLSFLLTIIAKKINSSVRDKSVSIVIPARNEEGNIENLFRKIPKVGSKTEVIFIEGHSVDNTYKEIEKCIKKYKNILPHSFKLIKQKNKGKADAVRIGFNNANGEILIIYDSDMSVKPDDINKFYMAIINNKGDFINGSRLVYPMEKNAMQFLNILGNKFFSIFYSWILGQKIKDTLCGTKVLWKKDYMNIKKEYFFGNIDPFGDFELLLGAGKNNLKIIDIPIRYYERIYGSTNIKRFKNALELLKFSILAIKVLKIRIID